MKNNALAMLMPRPAPMGVDPTRASPGAASSITAGAPAPMQAPRSNALATPMTANFNPPKPKQQNMLLSSAVNGFQRGLDPKGWQAGQDQAKADKAEGVKKQIAMLQNIRALPMEQRMQALPQISQSIGKQIPPELMQDQAIDTHLAMLMGEAGMAPSTPEPMSEYQRAQIALEEQKANQPRNQFIQGPDGALSVGNLNDGTIRQLQPGQPKPDPANYDMVTTADGVIAVNKRNPNDKIRIGAAPPKTGSGGATNPAGLTEDQMKTEIQLADKWDKVAAEWQDVTNMASRAKAMGARADSVGDLQLTIALTKLADPGTAAREGEVELTQQTASLVSQAQNWIEKLQKGNTLLPPEVRKAMLDAVGEMEGVYSDFYSGVGERTKARVEQYGLDPRRVFLTMQPNSMREQDSGEIMRGIDEVAASPTGSGAVPAEAAADLMRDPSPEAVAEFDDVFGAGMAQRVLNGSR